MIFTEYYLSGKIGDNRWAGYVAHATKMITAYTALYERFNTREFLTGLVTIIVLRKILSHEVNKLIDLSKAINHLTPNGHFSGRTAPLTYRCCIFYLFNRYTYWIF